LGTTRRFQLQQRSEPLPQIPTLPAPH